MEMKTCSDCHKTKPLAEFAKQRHLYRKRCLRCHRVWMTARRWGFGSVQEYLEFISGTCQICDKPEHRARYGIITRLVIDHDAEKNLIRGVLCCNCNIGIGQFNHDIDKLKAAIVYLERSPTRECPPQRGRYRRNTS